MLLCTLWKLLKKKKFLTIVVFNNRFFFLQFSVKHCYQNAINPRRAMSKLLAAYTKRHPDPITSVYPDSWKVSQASYRAAHNIQGQENILLQLLGSIWFLQQMLEHWHITKMLKHEMQSFQCSVRALYIFSGWSFRLASHPENISI